MISGGFFILLCQFNCKPQKCFRRLFENKPFKPHLLPAGTEGLFLNEIITQ
jgi:hypothetical protein